MYLPILMIVVVGQDRKGLKSPVLLTNWRLGGCINNLFLCKIRIVSSLVGRNNSIWIISLWPRETKGKEWLGKLKQTVIGLEAIINELVANL